jgi:hypothetical protein
MNENSAADRARLRAAAEAGKRASAKLSPMEQDAKRGFGTLMIRFALARVNAVIDEVDATTPDKVFGQPIDEFGKKGKR